MARVDFVRVTHSIIHQYPLGAGEIDLVQVIDQEEVVK